MAHKTTMDYLTTATTDSVEDFGDLRTQTHMGARDLGGSSNLTYGAYFGGYKGSSGGYTKDIEFISIGTLGNTQSWDELATGGYECGGGSNESYGIRFGGNGPASVVEYWAWASAATATSFGSMTAAASPAGNACNSATRSVTAGGTDGSGKVNRMEFIAVGGGEADADTFGNLVQYGTATGNYKLSGMSNGTRGEFWGGIVPDDSYPSRISTDGIEYITIATESNATDQGNLTAAVHGQQTGQGSA